MALFSSSKKKATPAGTSVAKEAASRHNDGRLSTILRKPWFSEKALIGSEKGVYVFEVPAHATKPEVAAAIEKFYSVTPVKVRMVNLPAKTVPLRTRRGVGTRARRHKAYVYLKKGESITLG